MERLEAFLARFDDPSKILGSIRRLLALKDPLVAPAKTFLRERQSRQFETWDFPVTIQTVADINEGRLLSLPPGARRFQPYRRIIGEILDLHIHTRFPRLLAELANRPNLFFSGVFYPQELDVANMEMISAHHGTFYVVRADLKVGRRGRQTEQVTVVLKPTDMTVESILTFTIQFLNRRLPPDVREKIGPLLAPTIVAIDDVYGILELVPGKNGVEFLPRGIKTGNLQDLRTNEFPPDLDLSREEVLQIGREFAKQAVMAYYLRLYDRKPDQLMIHRTARGQLAFSHIDFGRALKRNYALPWKRHYDPSRPALTFRTHQIPYFEAAAGFIYLPHFIPAAFRHDLSPFDGPLRETIIETFVLMAREIKANAREIFGLFKYLIGCRTQYRLSEVADSCVESEDVDEVNRSILTLEDPRETIEAVLNLAYHEREGTAAIRVGGDNEDQGIYRRAMLSGDRVTSLRDEKEGGRGYRLIDYHRLGRVSYDDERKILRIEFGQQPERVIRHVEENFSRRLARYIRQFPGDPSHIEMEISSDGSVAVRKKSPEEAVGFRRQLNFPQDIMREINEAGSGFAPKPHVLAHADAYRKIPPADDYLEDEISKQRFIIAHDLESREILQFVRAVEPEDEDHPSPLREAMAEIIRYLLANPDFLGDKDPYESINQLVVSLGRKHLPRQWPDGRTMALEFLPGEFFEPPVSTSIFSVYSDLDLSHFVHLILTCRFADELGRRAALARPDLRLLRLGALLHDLNVLDRPFREVLMEPSGRLSRPILTAVLDRHADISVRIYQTLIADGRLDLDGVVDHEALGRILRAHHADLKSSAGGNLRRIQQILHLADNIAVFSDRTRPDHWNRGFLRLEDTAPRWIDAQLSRGLIDPVIWESAQGFFSDRANQPLLRRLDRLSAFYPQCYSALQMAASLHLGLNPQHPNPMADFRERHGADLVNRIFDNLMKSGLAVRDKIKVLNRLDSIGPMFRSDGPADFAFINAGAQPVQRVVELIIRFVTERRVVILMGTLPRVIKAYERFQTQFPALPISERERVRVIAGERRLQFVTHSYPYEAEFKMPFHQIIRSYRQEKNAMAAFCLIPFERFMSSYAPTDDPERRVRKLEKASDVEKLMTSDHVRAEADRYLKWESTKRHLTFDDRGKERFRRILLGGFTNREVLLFYDATIQGDPPFQRALREVIGALRENPNYLSDRSVYYSIQELVRSLGQIHFYADDAPSASPSAALRTFLQDHHLTHCVPLTSLLDALKPQFNFVKHNISISLQLAVLLGRKWEAADGTRLDPAQWRRICAGTLLTGQLLSDESIADYALSPEDVSAHRSLRHLLSEWSGSMVALMERYREMCRGIEDDEWPEIRNLFDEAPLSKSNTICFLLIQTSLVFSSFCDFSKVENWKRGWVHIAPNDLESLWEFVGAQLLRLCSAPAGNSLDSFGKIMRAFCAGDGPETLNRHARATHSYIRLHNALSLAAELRYGLKARGFDLFHNVRILYGTEMADTLTDAIMSADFPLREKVKFARKLRILAAALGTEKLLPEQIYFIHTDHPLGVPPVEDLTQMLQDRSETGNRGAPLLIPAGDYDRTERVLLHFQDRLSGGQRRHLMERAKFLVGESYPLLIKEKSLLRTGFFESRISDFRRRQNLSTRNIFLPVGELLDFQKRDDPPDAELAGREKGLFFFRTWMKLFE